MHQWTLPVNSVIPLTPVMDNQLWTAPTPIIDGVQRMSNRVRLSMHRGRMRCLRRLRERSYFPPEPGSGTPEEPGVGPRGRSDTPPSEGAGERRAEEPCPPDPAPDVGDPGVGDAIPPSGMECAQDVPFDAAHSCHDGCMPPTTTDAGPATQTDGLSVDVGAVDSTVLPCAPSRPSSPVESEDGAVYM